MLSVGKLTIFNRFLEIFALKYGSFSPKVDGNVILSKSVSGYFRTKKKHFLYCHEAEARGGGLKIIFFAASLTLERFFFLM